MSILRLTRRAFVALAMLAALPRSLRARSRRLWPSGGGRLVFRRSGGSRRISRAAKGHNANRRYRTRVAAINDLPHPGDRSRVVWELMNDDLYKQLFGDGRDIVDLRRDL